MFEKMKKRKIISGTKGAISILLCLLLMPFLTVATALIEYSRYQNTAQTLQELIDLSTLSTISNYDSYVNERFGLFTISQDFNISTEFNNNLNNNISLLGRGVTLNDEHIVNGSYSLSDYPDILKTQVLDFSEYTVLIDLLSNIVIEGWEIKDLLKKINGFEEIKKATGAIADLAEAVEELVEAGEKLYGFGEVCEGVKGNFDNFSREIAHLVEELGEITKGITIDENTDFGELFSDPDDIFGDACDVTDTLCRSIEDLIDELEDLPGAYGKFQDALEKARDTVLENAEELAKDALKDAGGSEAIATATTGTYRAIIEAIDKAFKKFEKKLIDGKTIKEFIEKVEDQQSKCEDLREDLSDAKNGEFNEDLLQFQNEIEIKDILEGFQSAIGEIKSGIEEAGKELVSDTASNILTTLVNAVKNLFDLDVFYNGDLDAFLNEATVGTLLSEDMNNPYKTLLGAIVKMMDASDKLTSPKSFLGALTAVKDIIVSVKVVFQSIFEQTQKMIVKIGEIAGYIEDPVKFYELILLSAYMTKNLPNRTDAGSSIDVSLSDGFSYSTNLEGKALTGFPYSKIVVPPPKGLPGISGLEGLNTFFENPTKGGNGNGETMFRGAELEYILAGTESEIMNQVIAFFNLYLLRMLLNIPAVFIDNEVKAMAGAATVLSWAVYLLVFLFDPFIDTVFLVNGGDAALIKKSCYLTPSGILELIEKISSLAISNEALKNSINSMKGKLGSPITEFDKGSIPLKYDTYTLLALFLNTTESDMLTRLANIIQLESNEYYKKKGKQFDIKKANTCITSETTVTYNSFLSVFEFNDMSIFTRTYRKSRGY